MSLLLHLAPFAALGFLGSLHCAGMCGGFAVAASLSARGRRAFLRRQALHHLGRGTAYAVVCGLVAHAGALPPAGGARAVAWVAGTGLVLLGLSRLFPGAAGRLRLPSLAPRLQPVFAGARSLPGASGRFAVGVLNGLLPCGLSAGAFLLAAGERPEVALLGGLSFGTATAPALLLCAGLPRLRVPALRRHAPRLLGTLLIACGLLTWTRGAPGVGTASGHCDGTAPAPAESVGAVDPLRSTSR